MPLGEAKNTRSQGLSEGPARGILADSQRRSGRIRATASIGAERRRHCRKRCQVGTCNDGMGTAGREGCHQLLLTHSLLGDEGDEPRLMDARFLERPGRGENRSSKTPKLAGYISLVSHTPDCLEPLIFNCATYPLVLPIPGSFQY
jgi:hypothetical protein